jgi:hypothetical protein
VCRSVIGELATARTRFSVNYSLQEETEKKLHTIDSVGSHPCLPQRAGWQIACQLIWNNLQNPTRPLSYFSLAYLYYTNKWPPPRIVNTLWNVHGIACISEKNWSCLLSSRSIEKLRETMIRHLGCVLRTYQMHFPFPLNKQTSAKRQSWIGFP